MNLWRRFERTHDRGNEYFEIRQEGIRCFLRWGSTSGRGKSSTVVLLDENHARRHLDRKIKERLRKGFDEVPAPSEPPSEAAALVVPAILQSQTKPWLTPQEYRTVDGFSDVVCQANVSDRGGGGFYHYLALKRHRAHRH